MQTTVTKNLNVQSIVTDRGTQSRAELDEGVVEEYATALTDGQMFPPVKVYWDGVDYILSRGFHRVAAHILAGRASIKAEIATGTQFDAMVDSIGDNWEHGIRRSNADKRHSVMLLLAHPQSAEWSNTRIADMAGVTAPFVGDIKAPARRAERKIQAKARAGEKATPRDPIPGSEAGRVEILQRPHDQTGKTVLPDEHEGYTKTEAEIAAEDPVPVLLAEVDRLQARLAVEAMDATDEEKAAAADTMRDQAARIKALEAENRAIASQRDAYMRENGELKSTVKRLQRKLEQSA